MHRKFLFLALAPLPALLAQAALPTEWTDPDTGHRVIRLSREDGTQSLYFNQNAYTADGKKLIVTTAGGGISTIELATREIKPLVPGPVSVMVAGRKSGDVYYTKRLAGAADAGGGGGRNSAGAIVYATNTVTGVTREVVKLPPGRNVSSLNADETLLLGTYVDGVQAPRAGGGGGGRAGRGGRANGGNASFGQANYAAVGADGKPMTFADAKDLSLHNSLMSTRAGPPRVLFTVNIKTGELKEILREHEWLGHLQFSPTDPNLIMFCHEGTWHEVDRIWTVHTDGSALTKIHTRTMNMEIAGHEFFSADGARHLVRPADAARAGFLAGQFQSGDRQTYVVSPAAERMVGALQRVAGRDFLCGRRRRQRDGGARARRQVDLPVPAGACTGCGRRESAQFRRAHRHRILPGGTARQHEQAPLSAGAERDVFARHEVDRVPIEHVGPGACLRGGNRESGNR